MKNKKIKNAKGGQMIKTIKGTIIKTNNPPDNPHIGAIIHDFKIRNRLFSQQVMSN